MLQECSIWRVLQVFFDDPDPEGLGLSLREISRASQLAHTSVKRHLQTLIDEKLVRTKRKQTGSREYPVYLANRESQRFRRHKAIDTIHRIQESGLLDKLIRETTPDCILLFGTAARGEDTLTSDIDLYLQCTERPLNLSEYESLLQRNIQLHFRPHFDSFPDELKNNIINGTILFGYLKAFGE